MRNSEEELPFDKTVNDKLPLMYKLGCDLKDSAFL